MKICSKQADVCVKSDTPNYKYKFKEADKPIEVDPEHAEKILKNPTFYKDGAKEKSINKKVTKE